jgi:hypothetical protein
MRKVGLSQRLGPHGMYPTEATAVAALQGLASWDEQPAGVDDDPGAGGDADLIADA